MTYEAYSVTYETGIEHRDSPAAKRSIIIHFLIRVNNLLQIIEFYTSISLFFKAMFILPDGKL